MNIYFHNCGKSSRLVFSCDFGLASSVSVMLLLFCTYCNVLIKSTAIISDLCFLHSSFSHLHVNTVKLLETYTLTI